MNERTYRAVEDKQAHIRNAVSQIRDKRPVLQRTLTLLDPEFKEACKERHVPGVPAPAAYKPSEREFYWIDNVGRRRPNSSFLRSHFKHEGRITTEQALYLLHEVTDILRTEPNLLEVRGPITVCGDIHGQYYDLMKIFEIGGDVLENNAYLFLGDYVDRGYFGIECLLYLYSLKICYPDHIFMLRGNHECKHLTEYFTFQRECSRKYSAEVYDACTQSFCALPLAAILDRRFFCVHGGISPELTELNDIMKLERFSEPPSHGLLCDLLWADPSPDFDHDGQHVVTESFLPNPLRGCSYHYTYDAACSFLERNRLLGIIRGHEVQQEGFQMSKKTRSKKFPAVITIFSAPNYCDLYKNRGAVLRYVDKNITIRQFNASSHPYWLPNFMDAFTWSLPFVGDKIIQMLIGILSCCTAEELKESPEDGVLVAAVEQEEATRRDSIRSKILAVGRARRVFQILREEAELGSEYSAAAGAPGGSSLYSSGISDPDELGVRVNQIRRNIRNFDDARQSDLTNERLPEFRPEDDLTSPFTMVQAPSMRQRTPDYSLEEKLRQLKEGNLDPGQEIELFELAERITQISKSNRRQTLTRFGTS